MYWKLPDPLAGVELGSVNKTTAALASVIKAEVSSDNIGSELSRTNVLDKTAQDEANNC